MRGASAAIMGLKNKAHGGSGLTAREMDALANSVDASIQSLSRFRKESKGVTPTLMRAILASA